MSSDSMSDLTPRGERGRKRELGGQVTQQTQVNQPSWTEDQGICLDGMEEIEKFIVNLTIDNFLMEKERVRKEAIEEMKWVEDKERYLRTENERRVKSYQERRHLPFPLSSPTLSQESWIQERQEYASFARNMDQLNKDRVQRQKAAEDIIKRLEEKQEYVLSFFKCMKYQDELFQTESNQSKSELRREWYQAKPLDYFISKIKDLEALLSDPELASDSAKSLFGFEGTPGSSKLIIKHLSGYMREYGRDSVSDVCSGLFQLPFFTLNKIIDHSRYVSPVDSLSKKHKNMIFIPKEMREETTAFSSPDIELVDILASLFSNIPQSEPNMNQRESSLITYHILTHLAKLLGVTKRSCIKVKPQSPVRSGGNQTEDIIPDFSMVSHKDFPVPEDIRFLVVESKEFPFIPEEMATNNNIKQEINRKLNSIFKQLVIDLVEGNCSHGIVCDWKRAILVEIDLKELAKIMKCKRRGLPKIPLYFRVIDIHNIRPSYLQVLFTFLATAFDKEKEDKRMFDSLDLKGYLDHFQNDF